MSKNPIPQNYSNYEPPRSLPIQIPPKTGVNRAEPQNVPNPLHQPKWENPQPIATHQIFPYSKLEKRPIEDAKKQMIHARERVENLDLDFEIMNELRSSLTRIKQEIETIKTKKAANFSNKELCDSLDEEQRSLEQDLDDIFEECGNLLSTLESVQKSAQNPKASKLGIWNEEKANKLSQHLTELTDFMEEAGIPVSKTAEQIETQAEMSNPIDPPNKTSFPEGNRKEILKWTKTKCKELEKTNRDIALCFLNPTKENLEKATELHKKQLGIEEELKDVLEKYCHQAEDPFAKQLLALIPDRLKKNIAPEKTKRMMWKQLFKISRHPKFFKWCVSIIGFSIVELGKGTAKKLTTRVSENNPSPINKAIATIHTRFSALGAAHLRMVLGSSLILPSRNILQAELILEDKDIALGNKALENGLFPATCNRYQRDGASFKRAPVEHTYSGICEGTCLQLSIDLLQSDSRPYLEIAGQNIEGAPIGAYVNQLCYNSTSRNPTYTLAMKIVEHRIEHALNEESAENGLFKANGTNVKKVLDLFSGRPSDNTSSLYKAASDWKAKPENKDKSIPSQIKDIQSFYNDLKLELKDDPQALNELEWVVSGMEMINYCRLVEEANDENLRNPLKEYTDAKGNKITTDTLPDQFNLEAFVSNQDTVNTLQALLNLEFDCAQSRPVANFRGVDYTRMDRVVGQGYMHKDDAETLDRMSGLLDGVYMLGIQIGTNAHALQYYKKGGEEYLFDPNFGVIDCSGGKLKEEFLKLLQSPVYPPAKNQGPHSSGKSHNIVVHQVKKAQDPTDNLSKILE